MKKSIIIAVVIAVVILGLLIWVGQSKPLDKALNSLQAEKTANLEKMKEAVLKSATLNIVLMTDDYYQKNPTGVFEKDVESLAKVNNYLDGVKDDRGVDIEYFVHSTKINYVVKVKAKDANNFYCLDTTAELIDPKLSESVDSFNTTTDCKGIELK